MANRARRAQSRGVLSAAGANHEKLVPYSHSLDTLSTAAGVWQANHIPGRRASSGGANVARKGADVVDFDWPRFLHRTASHGAQDAAHQNDSLR